MTYSSSYNMKVCIEVGAYIITKVPLCWCHIVISVSVPLFVLPPVCSFVRAYFLLPQSGLYFIHRVSLGEGVL